MTTTVINQLALQDFERASRKRFWRDLFSRLARKCNNLPFLLIYPKDVSQIFWL